MSTPTPTPPPVVNAPDPAVVAVLVPTLAYRRCVDLHPDRHDMGGVGVCAACKSWAEHVATAQATALAQAQDPAREALARIEALADGWAEGGMVPGTQVAARLRAALASRDIGEVTT